MYIEELQLTYFGSCPESLEKARQVLYEARQQELAVLFSLAGIEMKNEYEVSELNVVEAAA